MHNQELRKKLTIFEYKLGSIIKNVNKCHSSCLSVKSIYIMVNDELIIMEYCIIIPLMERVQGENCLSKDHTKSAAVL